nr:MAG TPA: hypothetical protein [Caudoviricetes sp.]
MTKKDKLKDGNSLETQFWSDNVKVDKNSPLTELANKLWNSKEDYIPTQEEKKKYKNDMKEYHKRNSTK